MVHWQKHQGVKLFHEVSGKDFALKPLHVENFKGLIFVTASHNAPFFG